MPRALAASLARMVGFRNILVHDYTRLDPTIVVRVLHTDVLLRDGGRGRREDGESALADSRSISRQKSNCTLSFANRAVRIEVGLSHAAKLLLIVWTGFAFNTL